MASLLSFKGADTKAKDKHGKTPNGIADTSDVIDHDARNAGNDDEDEDVGGGTDMSKMFKGLTKKGCKACVAAGYRWCPIKLMCGGFAKGVGPYSLSDRCRAHSPRRLCLSAQR